ncbi:alpha/beta fold hydrolase, partial [Maritimibacter sp. 55A14]|uniref:alpha/beta fold hydrolase n=1 Tax=Maritimibacter sp. 55A14 TaxID=2174844 RepID=UPI001304899D
MDLLSNRFHLIAVNLIGYGGTAAWHGERAQTLEDQARLISPFLPADGGKVSIVGHSFGGSVAMKAAALFKDRIHRLILIEPNPFYLLAQHGRTEALQEALRLRRIIKEHGASGVSTAAAEEFANYWTGEGSWQAMSEDRQLKFTEALKPNFHEWDSVMDEGTPLSDWAKSLPSDTTVISAADTVRSIKEIVVLMQQHIPHWNFEKIERGGHMAPLTSPDKINPLVERAL